jgi:hypothetical protein
MFLTYLQEAFDAGKLQFFSSLEAREIPRLSATMCIRCAKG